MYYKIEHTFYPKSCISATNSLILSKLPDTTVKSINKTILLMTFFPFGLYFSHTKRFFHLQILNIIWNSYICYISIKDKSISTKYSHFNVIFKSNYFVDGFFSIYMGFSQEIELYYILKFSLKTYNVIFYSPNGNSNPSFIFKYSKF